MSPSDEAQFHLYLSPHFDDAVLSCGGAIHQHVARGDTVVVYTVMAGKPPHQLPDSPILRDLHQRWGTLYNPVSERRNEDIKAVRQLGALARHGSLPDCVYRVRYSPGGEVVALYPDEASLWGNVHQTDAALPLLDAMPLPYDQTTAIHVPLGAGHHVDHRLVRDWGIRLARAYDVPALCFYEEYPYSTDPAAVERALAHFSPRRLMPVLHALSEEALAAKIQAIAHYESQISTFWQDEAVMASAVRAYALQVGGNKLAEREWQPDSN